MNVDLGMDCGHIETVCGAFILENCMMGNGTKQPVLGMD